MSDTGHPLIPQAGYLIVKPLSPYHLRVVGGTTVGGWSEDLIYFLPPGEPRPLLVREREDETGGRR